MASDIDCLQFVGGGWVQNDETLIPYTDVIDQTTTGHEFLKKALNYTVQRGWQIDMFTGWVGRNNHPCLSLRRNADDGSSFRLQRGDAEHVGSEWI